MPRGLPSFTKCCNPAQANGGRSDKPHFLHHRRVDDDLARALLLDDLPTPRGFDSIGEPPFFSDALTSACQRRRVDRRFMLKVGLATELLPIRILHPDLELLFIGAGKGMLKTIEQAGYQAGRRRRASRLRRKERRATRFED